MATFDSYRFGDFRLVPNLNQLQRLNEHREILNTQEISGLRLDLLLFLVTRRAGAVVTNEAVREAVWPDVPPTDFEPNNASQYFTRLYSMLEDDRSDPQYIRRDKAGAVFLKLVIPEPYEVRDEMLVKSPPELPGIPSPKALPRPGNSRGDRERMHILRRVRQMWVEGLLNQPLYETARVKLGLNPAPTSLENPLSLWVQEAERTFVPMPNSKTIIDLFDQCGALLILGAPGSGKTTLLLELARDLLDRAETDHDCLVPVVFNLSSWRGRKCPIQEWLREQLTLLYDFPSRLAKDWVSNGLFIPLLDGLDEVADAHRNDCIDSLNEFRKHHGLLPIALCSRATEYNALSRRVNLQIAVSIQPLTPIQLHEYLGSLGDSGSQLRLAADSDPTICELLSSPLMISIAMLIHAESPTCAAFVSSNDVNGHRRLLFDLYIDKMLRRRAQTIRYKPDQVVRWLGLAAHSMLAFNINEIDLYKLASSPLLTKRLRVYMIVIHAIFFGLLFGGMALLEKTGPHQMAPTAVRLALVLGMTEALVSQKALPSDRIIWSWRSATHRTGRILPWMMVILFLIAVGRALQLGLALTPRGTARNAGIAFAIVVMAFITFGFGYDSEEDYEARCVRRDGVERSLINAGIGVLGGGVLGGVITIVLHGDPMFTVATAVFMGLASGGLFCIQHWTARLFLWISDRAPLDLPRFLEYARERVFLQQVGRNFIFIHRMFMEHLASRLTSDAEPHAMGGSSGPS